MSVSFDDSKMAMALLNWLLTRSYSLISALEAAHTDNTKFIFEFAQSRVQEERGQVHRAQEDLNSSEFAALFANPCPGFKRAT